MPGLRETSRGIELDVHIQVGARRNAITGNHANRLKVAVQAPPVDGKANDALTHLLARTFGVPRSRVTIHNGLKSRDKTLSVTGLTADQAEKMILEAIESEKA